MKLKTEQSRLYALFPKETRCFVRVCDDDLALWVSDFPRKTENCAGTAGMLREAGYEVLHDQTARLWYIDWTDAYWLQQLESLPEEIPPFPFDDEYHEAYALCRLYMNHSAGFDHGQLATLRRILKLQLETMPKSKRDIRALYEQAALQLRNGQKLPFAAGKLLAAWLNEQMNGRESAT